MRSEVGYELHFVSPPYEQRWLKPLSYLRQAVETWRILSKSRPDVVWYQSPPTFLAHLLWLFRVIGGHRYAIVADCHNAALRPPWAHVPFTSLLLNRFDLVLAHNAEVRTMAVDLGVTTDRLTVLETRPAQVAATMPRRADADGRPLVFVPTSFSADEPIDVLLQAAALLPQVRFALTGRLSRAKPQGYPDRAPDNVEFTDYIDVATFNRMLGAARVVVGLTTVEGIQLSAANEAIGAGKPLVLSDTHILRELFGAAAVFSRNDVKSLAAAIEDALARAPSLAQRSEALRRQRELRWRQQLQQALGLAGLR